jgi:hypothetical protein
MVKLTTDISKSIISEYSENTSITLRELSSKYGIHHVTISAFLKKNGIAIRRTGARIGHPVKESTRQLFSKLHAGNTYTVGRKQTNSTKLKIIATMWKVDYSALLQYPNANKVKLIIQWMNSSRNMLNFEISTRLTFLDHFYKDESFNRIWDIWIKNGKKQEYKPSIDHKIPYTRGGTCDFANLQIITWFENRAKGNMTESEWEIFKKVNNLKCDLFI